VAERGTAAGGPAAPPGRAPAEVRLLTYNVRSLRDDRHALARVIRACAPDLVCVQEAPRFLRWRSKCAALARTSGLFVVTGGRTAGAMLLLSSLRVRVLATRQVLLARTPGLHQRGLALASVEVGGARFGVASMHLSLDAAERLRQVDEVLSHLGGLGESHVVLAGDVNERPGEPGWRRLAAELQDGWAVAPAGGEFTSPASGPVQRIDGVFASAGVRVVGCGVPDLDSGVTATAGDVVAASDHCPVLAVLQVPGAG
jgi:endonuclease/exonuclease/phosphatase family metal-dependent hydrolase